MRSPSLRGRLPAGSGLLLIPAASLVVHQLRYWLAYGSRANAELTAQGHSYLYSLTPWFVFALGIGLALFLRRAALALRTGDAGVFSRRSSLMVWLLAWAGLVAIYALQELLEELLASGHPGGFAGVFGHGGFWAVPVAAAVAGLVTLCLRVARAVLRVAAETRLRLWPRSLSVAALAGHSLVAPAPLARSYAGRAPPLAPASR
jgi:hypothetical protein